MIRALFAALAFAVTTPVLAVDVDVEIQEVTSPGGIVAWLVEEPAIPFTALEIRFKGGTALDADGKRGAINLMVATLEEGAAERDARAFAAAVEDLAASFEFDAHDDAVSVSARFLTENRDEAAELLRTALVEPRFDPDAVERVRAQVLSILASDATDPNEIASRAFDALAFGDHPYGASSDGTVESVAALTRADLLEAKDRVMAKDRVHVAAVGNISAAELGPLLDRLLGELPEAGAPLPDDVEVALDAAVTVVPFDTPQSVALFGHEGIARDDPDFFAAFVVNHVLGGAGFESRLMGEVREKRGLTYGIGTYLVPKDHAALLMGQTATANGRVAETIAVIRDEWRRIAETGLTEAELAAAKTFLIGSYPLRFDGNGTIAGILVGMQLEDLPIDYVATRNANIEAVTLAEARRVAGRIYRPNALHFVVVGQPEGLAAQN